MGRPLDEVAAEALARNRQLGAAHRDRLGVLDAERETLILDALKVGLTIRRIAELTGLSYGRVGHLARFENGDWRRGRRREELKE